MTKRPLCANNEGGPRTAVTPVHGMMDRGRGLEGVPMHLEVTDRDDGISQVALVGKLDVGGLRDVESEFRLITATLQRPTIVDLSGLEYIASLGMGLLIACAQNLQRGGKPMVLVGAHGDVHTALRTAGIDQAIPMVGDLDEATAAIRGGA